MARIFAVLLMGFALGGCAMLPNSQEIGFEEFKSLQVNGFKKVDVRRRLGEPQRIVEAKDLSEDMDVWVYRERNGHVRLTIGFDPKSEEIIVMTWRTRDADRLKTYADLSAKFPQAAFRKDYEDGILTGHHSSRPRVFYEDLKVGITMSGPKDDSIIRQVTWMQASGPRNPAKSGLESTTGFSEKSSKQ